jgi:hypothetical protein
MDMETIDALDTVTDHLREQERCKIREKLIDEQMSDRV